MSTYTERATFNPAFEKAVPKDAIVIEDWLPGPTHRAALLTMLRENYWTELADQIEAQTKPPRIPEPTGLGAVVEDEGGNQWVRMGDGPAPWMLAGASPHNRDTYAWPSLRPTRALSLGVEDEQ